MRTITEYRPLLIGELLARAARRKAKRSRWRQLFGLEPRTITRIARFGPNETVISHRQ